MDDVAEEAVDVEYTVPDAEPLADYWTSGEYIPSETIQYQQPSEKKDPTVQEDDEVERPMSIQEEELEAPTVPENRRRRRMWPRTATPCGTYWTE